MLTLSLLLVSGFLAANLVGRRLVARWESLVARIPLVRPIYTGAKKVSETLLSDQGQAFRQVLLIEYPRRGIWASPSPPPESSVKSKPRRAKR